MDILGPKTPAMIALAEAIEPMKGGFLSVGQTRLSIGDINTHRDAVANTLQATRYLQTYLGLLAKDDRRGKWFFHADPYVADVNGYRATGIPADAPCMSKTPITEGVPVFKNITETYRVYTLHNVPVVIGLRKRSRTGPWQDPRGTPPWFQHRATGWEWEWKPVKASFPAGYNPKFTTGFRELDWFFINQYFFMRNSMYMFDFLRTVGTPTFVLWAWGSEVEDVSPAISAAYVDRLKALGMDASVPTVSFDSLSNATYQVSDVNWFNARPTDIMQTGGTGTGIRAETAQERELRRQQEQLEAIAREQQRVNRLRRRG